MLLALDDHRVASDGFVEIDGDRVEMAEVVERKFKGDSLKMHVLRDKKEMDVTIQLKPAWPYLIQSNFYDVRPRFVLFGGLVFQPLSRDFLEAYGIDDLRVRYFYDSFVTRDIFLKHPEVVILSQVLPDPINAYIEEYRNAIVSEVNGHEIKRLEDLAAAFAETVGLLRDQMHRRRPAHRAGTLAGGRRPRPHQDRLQRRQRSKISAPRPPRRRRSRRNPSAVAVRRRPLRSTPAPVPLSPLILARPSRGACQPAVRRRNLLLFANMLSNMTRIFPLLCLLVALLRPACCARRPAVRPLQKTDFPWCASIRPTRPTISFVRGRRRIRSCATAWARCWPATG